MFGLDQYLAGLSDGTSLIVVAAIACLLGLRHATDPDHLAAVTTLVAGGRERGSRLAGRLGLAWGSGHAAALFAFGLPIVLFKAYLPEEIERGAETAVGLVVVMLAAWLLVRWRRGVFHSHVHGGPTRLRSPLQAFAIGLLHGVGGSAGVGVLLLASIHDRTLATAALGLFAACTAISMAALSTSFGLTLSSAPVRRSFHRLAPVLGTASLAFGAWYALGALNVAPYVF
jgi:high-affinity nickel-transport protein